MIPCIPCILMPSPFGTSRLSHTSPPRYITTSYLVNTCPPVFPRLSAGLPISPLSALGGVEVLIVTYLSTT